MFDFWGPSFFSQRLYIWDWVPGCLSLCDASGWGHRDFCSKFSVKSKIHKKYIKNKNTDFGGQVITSHNTLNHSFLNLLEVFCHDGHSHQSHTIQGTSLGGPGVKTLHFWGSKCALIPGWKLRFRILWGKKNNTLFLSFISRVEMSCIPSVHHLI